MKDIDYSKYMAFFRRLMKDVGGDFNLEDVNYQEISGALRAQRSLRQANIVAQNLAKETEVAQKLAADAGEEKIVFRTIPDIVLALHIPGTSQKSDYELPTYQSLKKARTENPNSNVAFHSFEGVGSENLSPVFQDLSSLSPQRATNRSGFQIFKSAWTARSGKAPENQFVFGDTSARILGLLAGAGKTENVILAINLLHQLKRDGLLPKTIFLSGFSRGAVASIALANAIYTEFGNEIKIHLCLMDPVPGPQTNERPEEHVIPPNVETFTTIYSRDYHYFGFEALDLTELTFSNPNTVVTSFSIPDTEHSLYEQDKAVGAMVEEITYAALGIPKEFNIVEHEKYPTNEMVAMSGNRTGSIYGKLTAIHPACSQKMATTLHLVRKTFFADYVHEQSMVPHCAEVFNLPDFKTREERQKFIIEQYVNSDKQLQLFPQQAKSRLEEIRRLIFAKYEEMKTSTKEELTKDPQTNKIVEFEFDSKRLKMKMITNADYDILIRIKSAKEAARGDDASEAYLTAWNELTKTPYGREIIATTKRAGVASLIVQPATSSSSSSSSTSTDTREEIDPKDAYRRLMEIKKIIFQQSSPIEFADNIQFPFTGFSEEPIYKFVVPKNIEILSLISLATVNSKGDPQSKVWVDTWHMIAPTDYGMALAAQELDRQIFSRMNSLSLSEVPTGETPNASERSESSTSSTRVTYGLSQANLRQGPIGEAPNPSERPESSTNSTKFGSKN